MRTPEHFQADHPLRARLGYKLRRVSSQLMAVLAQELAGLEIAPTEASILLLVERRLAETQSDICRELGLKRANMVPLVAALERRGLLERTPIDGRSFRLEVTADGAAKAHAAASVMDAHEDRFFSSFDEQELQKVSAFLDKLNEDIVKP